MRRVTAPMIRQTMMMGRAAMVIASSAVGMPLTRTSIWMLDDGEGKISAEPIYQRRATRFGLT
jgi:hypothetical protein